MLNFQKRSLGTFRRRLGLNDYLRPKELAKLVKQSSPGSVIKRVTVKHAKRLHLKHDGHWYRFGSAKEVIIPYSVAAEYALAQDPNIKPANTTMLDPELLAIQIPEEQGGAGSTKRVIVLLGHFNHGKTTLLDALGNTKFVDDEAHGITQEIRLKTVPLVSPPADSIEPEIKATVVDTPGQNIFFRMRNYGASVADTVVLVVALDAGIDEQTRESIGILQELRLPAVVCITKADVYPDAQKQKAQLELLTDELRAFEGLETTPLVLTSARAGTGLNELRQTLVEVMASADDHAACRTPEEDSQRTSDARGSNASSSQREHGHASAAAGVGVGVGVGVPVWDRRGPGPGGAAGVPTALGYVANAWQSVSDGHCVSVVMSRGHAAPGQAYASGGWAGTVKTLLLDGDRRQRVSQVSAGDGVSILLSVTRGGEPRPLGEPIFFFDRLKDAVKYAEQCHMAAVLPHFRMSREEAHMIRYLDEVYEGRRRGASTKGRPSSSGGSHSATGMEIEVDDNSEEGEAVWHDRSAEVVSHDRENDNGFEDDDDDDSALQNVILKADSEIVLGTVVDSVAIDVTQNVRQTSGEVEGDLADGHDDDGDGGGPISSAWRLIRTGVGNLKLSDVRVAEASNATVFLYNVSMDTRASKRVKQANLKVRSFETVEALLAALADYEPRK